MPCSRAIQATSPSFVWELALVECPVPMDLVWLVMTRCCCCGCMLLFSVWFRCCTWGRALSYGGGVLICSPWYVLVALVWDRVGHILFSGVYTTLYIWDSLIDVL